MNDARKALAAIVSKTRSYVDEARKRKSGARVITASAMASSASAKEAELLKNLDAAPRQAPAAELGPVKALFVAEAAISPESPAGRLLAKIIQAMGLGREDAAVCALSELEAALPRRKPLALVSLGPAASAALLKSEAPFPSLRGRFAAFQGLPLMPTHHPAEVLKNDALKRSVWEDMKLVAAKLK